MERFRVLRRLVQNFFVACRGALAKPSGIEITRQFEARLTLF